VQINKECEEFESDQLYFSLSVDAVAVVTDGFLKAM